MAKTSEAGVAESETARRMNVEGEKADFPAELAAYLRKTPKIQICMILAAMILTVFRMYSLLLYIVLPFAVSDSSAKELSCFLYLVGCIVDSVIMSLVVANQVCDARNRN